MALAVLIFSEGFAFFNKQVAPHHIVLKCHAKIRMARLQVSATYSYKLLMWIVHVRTHASAHNFILVEILVFKLCRPDSFQLFVQAFLDLRGFDFRDLPLFIILSYFPPL